MINPEHMTEEMVMLILKNKEGLCRQKEIQIREIQKELLQIDRLGETAIFPGKGTGKIQTVNNHLSDLTDVLLDMYKREKEMVKALLIEYKQVANDLEAIRRVWICFQALPYEEYEILYRLYVKKELWLHLEETYNHRTLIKKRKEGLKLIVDLYKSNYLNREIAARRFMEKRKKKDSRKCEVYSQVSLQLKEETDEGHGYGKI